MEASTIFSCVCNATVIFKVLYQVKEKNSWCKKRKKTPKRSSISCKILVFLKCGSFSPAKLLNWVLVQHQLAMVGFVMKPWAKNNIGRDGQQTYREQLSSSIMWKTKCCCLGRQKRYKEVSKNVCGLLTHTEAWDFYKLLEKEQICALSGKPFQNMFQEHENYSC